MIERLQDCAVFSSLGLLAMALSGCQMITPNVDATAMQTPSPTPSLAVSAVIGDYVSADYARRDEGFDWTRVSVRAAGRKRIHITVKSRADIKKPTCTFDGTATLMGQDTAHGIIFKTHANDSATFLQFKAGALTIDSEDNYALHAFCSGGATLAGKYQKIDSNSH